jgi:hypothetical protein
LFFPAEKAKDERRDGGGASPTFDQTTSSSVRYHFFQRERHTMMASGYG